METSNSVIGYLLLSDEKFHIIEIIATLIRKYNVDVKYDESVNAFTFSYKDYIIGASFVNSPMDNDNVVESCKYNFLWQNSEEIVASHKSHVLLSVLNCKNKLDGYRTFTNFMCVLANFDNAIAIYMPASGLTLNAQTYIEDARIIAKGENPLHLWICICPVEFEDAALVYTYGLNEFGKNEIEARSTSKGYMEVFNFVYNLCDSIITNNITLESGDSVSTDEGDILTTVVNEGIYIDRVSAKFNV